MASCFALFFRLSLYCIYHLFTADADASVGVEYCFLFIWNEIYLTVRDGSSCVSLYCSYMNENVH